MENVEQQQTVEENRQDKGLPKLALLLLTFQSIGVVFGDIGTSPLYVLPGIFPEGINEIEDLLGVLSLIIYSLIMILMVKYVFIILYANDKGNGGTFALYNLICRHARISLIKGKDVARDNLDSPEPDSTHTRLALFVRSALEKSHMGKCILLYMSMLGTAMVIGDGILTPCISVLSAVSGLKQVTNFMTDTIIMWISVGVLVVLFQLQRIGTRKVGYGFSPVLIVWFVSIGGIGVYNFFKYDPSIIKALNPIYILNYFRRNKMKAWKSLSGIVLSLTGCEALFADLGHFNVGSIQLSTCTLVFPAIILAYAGQVSYLREHNEDIATAFYSSVPQPIYWPMLVVAVLAAIIASQAMISASYSLVEQAMEIGCFPPLKVVHTSNKYQGQVYVPIVNTLLMLACIGITIGFKTTSKIGNAYGLAVVFVYILTSIFMVIVMILIWQTNIFLIILYILTIGTIELLYLSSVLTKFVDGGYLPLAFSALLIIFMYINNYRYRQQF